MRRIFPHISVIAALAALCLAGQAFAVAVATAASAPPLNKAALNKSVQEAVTKQLKEGKTNESLGASEPLSNLTKGGEEEAATPTTATTSSSSASSGISTSGLIPIFIVGAVLLGGIAFFIVRDARSVAPAGDGLGGSGSSRDQAARLRKRRAKAKAARRQRKRNR
jgi:uncharacterized membrane protein